MSKYWKKPITSECKEWSALERAVFLELMMWARDEGGVVEPFWHGNKFYQGVVLERGQVVFSIKRYARELGVSSQKVTQSLKTLLNRGLNMELNRKSFGLVISMKTYDDLIKMRTQSDTQSKTHTQLNRTASMEESRERSESRKKIIPLNPPEGRTLEESFFVGETPTPPLLTKKKYGWSPAQQQVYEAQTLEVRREVDAGRVLIKNGTLEVNWEALS